MGYPVPIVNVGPLVLNTVNSVVYPVIVFFFVILKPFLLRAGNSGMTEPGATIAGSSSAMINQSSISSFSTIVLFQFFFLSLSVCAIKAVYVIITTFSCASFYFILLIWVTLPRAAHLLSHVPPNGGKLK